MKKLGLLFGAFAISITHLCAQVSVEVVLAEDQYGTGEAVSVSARITNLSGQPLHFGTDDTWLKFAVESLDGFVVARKGQVPVAGDFILDSSKRATKEVDLAPYFNLRKPGRYKVTATIQIKDWNGQAVSSPAKGFDIIEGSRLWEQTFGVPKAANASPGPPEVRRYSLHEANYQTGRLKLYVQVNDTAGNLNKMFPIGPMLSFGQPEPQIDRQSNLHVLYQSGPRAFTYTIINPDGDVTLRQTYDYTTRPRLKPDGQGNISVTGGNRRVTSEDIPPPKTASTDVKTPTP